MPQASGDGGSPSAENGSISQAEQALNAWLAAAEKRRRKRAAEKNTESSKSQSPREQEKAPLNGDKIESDGQETDLAEFGKFVDEKLAKAMKDLMALGSVDSNTTEYRRVQRRVDLFKWVGKATAKAEARNNPEKRPAPRGSLDEIEASKKPVEAGTRKNMLERLRDQRRNDYRRSFTMAAAAVEARHNARDQQPAHRRVPDEIIVNGKPVKVNFDLRSQRPDFHKEGKLPKNGETKDDLQCHLRGGEKSKLEQDEKTWDLWNPIHFLYSLRLRWELRMLEKTSKKPRHVW
ncbi:hypothetical protein F5Y10DRAFT_262244 [Nemania abortiva]|nr:hypothetical protein F5Y10DRAFT_262244 [Nemania abortiva]